MTDAQSSSATLPQREGENGQGRFKTVHDVSQEVQALYDATHERPRGSLIKHSEIEEITGHEKMVVDSKQRLVPNAIYQKIIRKWRKRILEGPGNGTPNGPGIAVVSSHGVGYRFATVEEQETTVPDSLEKQASRKIRAAQKTVENIPDSEMSDAQKRLRRERMRQTTEALDLNRTHVHERKSYMSNPDTLPRWNGGK